MTREEAIKILRETHDNALFSVRTALETLIPELHESEDERIRKKLIEIIGYFRSRGIDQQLCEKFLAYLEKQKDASKAIEAVDRIDKYIDENVANAHDMKDSNPDKKYYRGWDDALGEMAGILQDVYSNEKQQEQKPADLSEMMIHKEPYIAPVPAPMVADERKPAECIDFYDEFYKVYTGPKNILAYVNMFVKKLGYIPIDIHELSACVYYVIKHIEEDTKASQKEQKPSEWSEEDEAMLKVAIAVLRRYSHDDVANWLKSLHPQPYKEIYQTVKHDLAIKFMNYLDENRSEGKMSLSNGECEDIDKAFKENDWTKILRYAEKYGKKN